MIDNKNSKTDKSRKESFPKVHVNWVRRIYGKLAKSVENTDFLIKR